MFVGSSPSGYKHLGSITPGNHRDISKISDWERFTRNSNSEILRLPNTSSSNISQHPFSRMRSKYFEHRQLFSVGTTHHHQRVDT